MIVGVACVLLVLAAGLLAAGVARRHLGVGDGHVWTEWLPPDDTMDEREGWDDWEGPGGVREPRRPMPSGGAASIALPEPDDRAA